MVRRKKVKQKMSNNLKIKIVRKICFNFVEFKGIELVCLSSFFQFYWLFCNFLQNISLENVIFYIEIGNL